ncbi:hypothetical protein BDN72DRAFT_905000, partial [Pluteus cervinus]
MAVTIHIIPAEMRAEAFRYFRDVEEEPVKALLTLSHVCRQWRNDLHNNPALWSVFWTEPCDSYDWNL